MGKIYLSSTFEDLKAHREAVYRTLRQLRQDVVSMEDYVAAAQAPMQKCLADVSRCDAYVGLFAWRYGFRPVGEDRSITELELLEAERQGMPCLIFLLADDAEWPPAHFDADRGAIQALRERLRQRYTVQYFRSVDEVARGVATSAANMLGGDADAEPSPEDLGLYRSCVGRFTLELSNDIRFYAITSAVLVGAALVTLAVALAALNGSPQMLAAGGGLLFASTSPFPVVTMRATRKKKALLDGYADELSKERPARAAVHAVRRFVEGQLGRAVAA